MMSVMTSKTANSIESLLKLPFNIFLFQYKLLEERLKKEMDKKNKQSIQLAF